MPDRDGANEHRGEPPTVLVSGAATGGKLALLEVRVGRDTLLPVHLHHWDDEIVYVLEGEVTFHLDGERRPGPAGTCLLLPRGSEHSYSVESTEARLLVVVAPAGIEEFYGEQCRSGTASGLDLERLVTLGARYGVEVTGPAPGPGRPDAPAPTQRI
jgi:quercetin dioxygenase-like cupin family protein